MTSRFVLKLNDCLLSISVWSTITCIDRNPELVILLFNRNMVSNQSVSLCIFAFSYFLTIFNDLSTYRYINLYNNLYMLFSRAGANLCTLNLVHSWKNIFADDLDMCRIKGCMWFATFSKCTRTQQIQQLSL